MKREFDNILNECLDRLAQGESLEGCLETYPDHADELAPVLRMAQATQQFAATVNPRPDFKAQALYRLTQSMAEGRHKRKTIRWLPVMARPVILTVAVALLLVGGAGATTVAANSSVPGQPLYFVKMMKERVLLIVPRSDIAKARLQADLADARGEEMAVLARNGDVAELEKVARRLKEHLEKATSKAIARPVAGLGRETILLRDHIKENGLRHQALLQDAIENAPIGARPFIKQSIEESGQKFEEAIAVLGETNGVILGIDVASRSIILRPRFGEPVSLILTGSTRIMEGDREVSAANLLQFQGNGAWVDYDPHTYEIREIRILRQP